MNRGRILNSSTFWDFDMTAKVLTISGSGDMPDFNDDVKQDEPYFDKIPWKTFKNDIEKIIISDQVTTISGAAFTDCRNLKTALMPNVMQILPGAFYQCCSLETVVMPKVITIGNGAFCRCTALWQLSPGMIGSSVDLSSIIYIDDFGFANCERLEKVIFSKLKALGEGAFMQCSSLQSFSAERLFSIQKHTFFDCIKLNTLRVRADCLIDDSAFKNAGILNPTKYIDK